MIMTDNILFTIERLINYDYYLEYFEFIVHFFCIHYLHPLFTKLNQIVELIGLFF